MDSLSPVSSEEQRNCLELPPNSSEEPDSSEEQKNCLELPPNSSEEPDYTEEVRRIWLELFSDSSKESNSSEEQSNNEPDSWEEPDSTEEVRNWLELPPDVMSLIFLKLGATDILFGAQPVCSTWRKLSKEPHLWHSVDMRKRRDSFFSDEYIMEKMAREAVDRSCGQLVEFSVERFATDELLQYIADKTSALKCLRLVHCYNVSDYGLIEMAKKLPLLEELELCFCEFATEVLEVVGSLCPQLRSFRLNSRVYWCPRLGGSEDKALAIAKSMTQLCHLHLFGNMLTDSGLRAILDGCAHLESLDLRRCFNLNLEGDLLKRCVDGIRNLRLPDDSTDDYEYDTDGDDHESDADTAEYEFGMQRDVYEFYAVRDGYDLFADRDEYQSDYDSDGYDNAFYAAWRDEYL